MHFGGKIQAIAITIFIDARIKLHVIEWLLSTTSMYAAINDAITGPNKTENETWPIGRQSENRDFSVPQRKTHIHINIENK